MKILKIVSLSLILCILFTSICFAGQTEDSDETSTEIIQLTQEEKDFIAEHPVIYLGIDPNFVPYEFIDTDGEYKGISADYVKLICEKTGLNMVAVEDLTWTQAYEKAINKEIDVLPCVAKTSQREEYFSFTSSYYNFQRAIFVEKNNNEIKSFGNLYDRKVAVQINSSHQGFLSTYGSIEQSTYSSVEEAILAVSEGTESAFVGNLATTSYIIKDEGITNLKYIILESEDSQSLYFAVRNDWPELVSIINKALASMNDEEIIAINNKWIDIKTTTDYSGIIRVALIIGVIVFIVFFVSFFWILRMKKEIKMRRKIQDELKIAKNEAEKANQIKSMFLARMSHEIRTPLSAIMGMAYLIKKTETSSTQDSYLNKLTEAARNMLDIINDILDFSKIESGKIELEKVAFDLDKIIMQVFNIISVKAEEKNIEIFLEKEPGTLAYFIGDPVRIEQIFLNILNNAIKFTPEGSVSLTVEIKSQENNVCEMEFCVKDTGIGMTEEQISKLFTPFDQGDPSINRRFGGTGLGLSIVKNLADLMGGNIQVKSKLGIGTEFYIHLPLEIDVSKKEIENKKSLIEAFASIRALVIDKNKNETRMLEKILTSFGIKAEFIDSQEECVEILEKSKFNLLIVDSATLKSSPEVFFNDIKNVKCILIVPMGREDIFEKIDVEGIDFGITKPIISSTLYNGLIEIFDIRDKTTNEKPKEKENIISNKPYNILLVEDNKTNQFIAGKILEQAGLHVFMADDGEQGYNFFKDNSEIIDLILMDVHMPIMDGYTSADLIRKIDNEIPIVAMTADAIVGTIEKCKTHGMTHYVSKPFEPEKLIETILELLKKRK